jgi:hypothetical protein
LLYALALQEKDEEGSWFHDQAVAAGRGILWFFKNWIVRQTSSQVASTCRFVRKR